MQSYHSRPSIDFDDSDDEVDDVTTGRRSRRRRSEGDDDDWDEKEYAFGGRKNRNRNRYRTVGFADSFSSSSSPTTSLPPTPFSPALMLSRTSSMMSGDSIDAHQKRRHRPKLPKIFKKQSREQEEYEDEDVDVDVVPVHGLGLSGVDDSARSIPSHASEKTHTHPSSLDSLRSRAYKRYLALELSLTLGLVRTERKLKDWSGAKRPTLRTESF